MRILALVLAVSLLACNSSDNKEHSSTGATKKKDELKYEQEIHLENVQRLTYEGENAEAYFSFDSKALVFQRTSEESGIPCDQIFMGEIPKMGEEFKYNLISTGTGRTTCAYFLGGDQEIIFASTHASSPDCPPTPDREKLKRYVWPIYSTYEIYISNLNGEIVDTLTDNDFYDAEPTVSPNGETIVFTSTRNGDLDLYTMNRDGSNVTQITNELGYDGGAFFSPDGTKLLFRASRFKSDSAAQEYKDLLAQGLVAPGEMEIYICNIDGSDLRQVTDLGKANWAPFYHPSGEKILFSSNHKSKSGRSFNIFMINEDGSDLKQITYDETFDAFPMFSPDGKKLVWSSNRLNGGTRSTNIFVADWKEMK